LAIALLLLLIVWAAAVEYRLFWRSEEKAVTVGEEIAHDGLVWEPPPSERETGGAWPGPVHMRRDMRAEIADEERELAEPRLRQ